jgi:hypothetical protein
MAVNIVGEYRRKYIKERLAGIDPEAAHDLALNEITMQLLHDSAATRVPVNEKDLSMLKDLKTNPHYIKLLEDIVRMPEADQREYLRSIAKVPKLRLVK